MSGLLILTGTIGLFVSLVLIVIEFILKKPKKNTLIALVICFVMAFIGGATYKSNDSKHETQSQSEMDSSMLSNTSEEDEGKADIEETPEQKDRDSELEKEESEEEPVTDKTEEKTEANQEGVSNGHRDESLTGRGVSDGGREEPNYVNVIGYAAVYSEQEYNLKSTDDFQNLDYWKIPVFVKDKQFWEETGEKLDHKTEVVVKEQYLEHEGWGFYSGYLLVENTESGDQYVINVKNFITKPYWTYDDLAAAAKVGPMVAEYKQVSDYYPVTNGNKKVEIPDGTIVLITGTTSATGIPESNNIDAIVWKEWSVSYGGVDVYFNPEDLTVKY